MREKCTKKRSKMPDSLFVQMVLECYYPWLMEPENLDKDFPKSLMDNENDIDFDADFDEDEDYEDDLTRAQRSAGFYMDDDGECQYVDDDEENYEDDDRW